ncbi:MAG TPA: fasciclin domain-containing protein [Candidatus Nanopelagicales bacterium]
MFRKALAGVAAAATLAVPLALAAPAQASQTTILDVVSSVDRFTSTERNGLDVFRWDQRNWYDFDILTAAVAANTTKIPGTDATLLDAVQSPSTAVTLFAPNDRAFQLLAFNLTGRWYATEAGVLKGIVEAVGTGDVLGSVLLYHVVGGKVVKADVPLKTDIPTLNGQTFQVDVTSFGTLRIEDANDGFRDASIIRTDIDAGNSVIHSVSRVIMPSLG